MRSDGQVIRGFEVFLIRLLGRWHASVSTASSALTGDHRPDKRAEQGAFAVTPWTSKFRGGKNDGLRYRSSIRTYADSLRPPRLSGYKLRSWLGTEVSDIDGFARAKKRAVPFQNRDKASSGRVCDLFIFWGGR